MPAPLLFNERLSAQLQSQTADMFYNDEALLVIERDTGQLDEYNKPIVEPSNVSIMCSFEILNPGEALKRYGDLEDVAAEIRFGGPRPTKGNKVKIISRFGGQLVEPFEYEIVGINDRAAMGFVCPLKRVAL